MRRLRRRITTSKKGWDRCAESTRSVIDLPRMITEETLCRSSTTECALATPRVDSENKIHDDAVAASYGFRGALVPGITVYAYMTVPLVERFGLDWLERGSMQVKFHQPFYDGEEVIVNASVDAETDPVRVALTAGRRDGTACATALATINDRSTWLGER